MFCNGSKGFDTKCFDTQRRHEHAQKRTRNEAKQKKVLLSTRRKLQWSPDPAQAIQRKSLRNLFSVTRLIFGEFRVTTRVQDRSKTRNDPEMESTKHEGEEARITKRTVPASFESPRPRGPDFEIVRPAHSSMERLMLGLWRPVHVHARSWKINFKVTLAPHMQCINHIGVTKSL